VLLFDEDSEVVTHFVYNAPRELFPERLPRAIGLLAAPIKAREAIVLDDIRGHPDGVGIPVHHAPIAALLAAPLLAGDAIIGEIAVANAPTGRGFDDVDTQLLTDLAAHAGIAVRWAESRERARVEHEFRREIIATARHDIRNPLMIGKGYVSILRAKRPRMDDEQVAAALDAVGSAFDRIEGFVFRALTDEQTEPAAERPHWTPIGVVALLDALAADHTAVATQSGTKVATSCDVGTPKEFFGDGGMVREVLDNLITNAIKYGAPGGVVKVTARPEGDHVRFDVNNSGDGISLDDQQRIFDPYWRTDSARASTVTGTGLGLSIVRRLVTLHGGVVGVTSRPDDGTTIWVTFPVSPRHDGSA
jgi:signal transduction histidine kinase